MLANTFPNLSLKQLKQAVAIRERIESLERELGRIVGGEAPRAAAPRKKRRVSEAARAKMSASMKARWATRKGKKRVARVAKAKSKGRSSGAPMKDLIVGALKAAGKPGATIKDLAAKLGKNYANISVWFHTTGKGIKEIKKVEPGKFTWAS